MGDIHKAIVAVMREIGAIGKESLNEQQRYKYRGIEAVYNRVQPCFAKHGIFSYPKVLEQTRETGATKAGGTMFYARLTVEYTFAAADGSSISVVVVGEGMDTADKASNKAMAAAHKYAICQVLAIPFDVVDPDAHTPEWASRLSGKITLADLNGLKKVWAAKHDKEIADLDRDGKRLAFVEWVQATLGKEIDATDYQQWQPEDIACCNEALEQNAEPPELTMWINGIAPLDSLQACQEFREQILPDCPDAIRAQVEAVLAEHEKGLTNAQKEKH